MTSTNFHEVLRDLTLMIVTQTGLQMYAKVTEVNEVPLFEFWFNDLGYREGPVFKLSPEGLHRHVIEIILGEHSGPIIRQIKEASSEQLINAKALLALAEKKGFSVEIDFFSSALDELIESDSPLRLSKQQVRDHLSEKSFAQTVSNGLSQVVSAMAELIGFEEQTDIGNMKNDENEMEGAVSSIMVKKRERSARNRMLCIGYHGTRCYVCGFDSKGCYGSDCEVIEVHHLQPLSSLGSPRPFDPLTDLVPLCPNCHRAIHSRRPIPLTPEELRNMIRSNVRES